MNSPPPGADHDDHDDHDNNSGDDRENLRRMAAAALRFAQIGWYFVGSFLMCAAIGWWIDRETGAATPWGVMIGCLVGLILGGWLAVKELGRNTNGG